LPSQSITLTTFVVHRAALIEYAAGIVGCRARAEDVVQEAWLRFEAAATGRSLDQPQGYLYRIVRNLAFDLRRRTMLEQRHVEPGPPPEAVIADRASPEEDALYRQQIALMRQALAELPERTRVALEMHRLGEHRLKDIARHLGISIGLAHALVYEALDHCRRKLRREG
jgi:RNA polymerase sigma factor (sigma-70 family)